MANRHLIGKQVFELGLRSTQDSYALQQKVSDMVWTDLLPRLAQLFDGVAKEDEVIRIDRMELDLGVIALRNDNYQELADKIIEKLKKALSTPLYISGNGKSGEDVQFTHPLRQSLQKSNFDQWLHWLEKGTFPLYSVAPQTDWMVSVLETLALEHKAIDRLQAVLEKHSVALDRLVMQHALKDLKSIVELYTGLSQKVLLDIFKEFRQLYQRAFPKLKIAHRKLELVLWKRIFIKVILEGKKWDALTLGLEIFKIPSTYKIITEHLKEKTATKDNYPFLRKLLKTRLEIGKEESARPEKIMEDGKTIKEEILIESPQFIKNAGVVLLHPFLSSFFKKLKLVAAGEFKNFKSQSKSVLLIHFLATGEEKPKEYEMVLPKLLCGMPANLPLDHTLKLTKKEKKEAIQLLQAAIDHWGVLGNSSPDGLREGFLMREGKLENGPTGWKLQVEQKAQDILLDKLPWNLSLLKLPWMKEILKVDWR